MKNADVLLFMNNIPRKIVQLHNADDNHHLAEFILHDLCSDDCFQLSKAAFLVENPDFHCVKGVTGICTQETFNGQSSDAIWQKPQEFKEHMEHSSFNNKVRSIYEATSLEKGLDSTACKRICDDLALKDPMCIRWYMKHGNCGVLLVEQPTHLSEDLKKHLDNSVYFLSLCPIH